MVYFNAAFCNKCVNGATYITVLYDTVIG
jgi:hypothetical protein